MLNNVILYLRKFHCVSFCAGGFVLVSNRRISVFLATISGKKFWTVPKKASKMRMVSDCRKDRSMPTSLTLHTLPQTQFIHANRLIIASNRGPVEYHISHNKTLKHRRGSGGMITALIGAANRLQVTWVAMAMTEGDRIALREAQQNNDGLLQPPLRGQKMQLRFVAIPKTAYRKHYEQ